MGKRGSLSSGQEKITYQSGFEYEGKMYLERHYIKNGIEGCMYYVTERGGLFKKGPYSRKFTKISEEEYRKYEDAFRKSSKTTKS